MKPITIKDVLASANYLSKKELQRLEIACQFAIERHKGQKRASGEDYHTHTFEVARILAGLNLSIEVLIAGVLHDVLEDTDTTLEELEEKFGERVVFFVDSVTNLAYVKYNETSLKIKSIQKLFIAMAKDINVCIIKLIDRLTNMRTLEFLPKAKQKRISLETKYIYAPIADRLNMCDLKAEFEDLAFKYLETKKYNEVGKLVSHLKSKTTLEKFSKKITKTLGKNKVNCFAITSRIKTNYSIYKKLEAKKITFDKINDILAIRIITSTETEIYNILSILLTKWKHPHKDIKDYIINPKASGYKAVHAILLINNIPIEVQILTQKMYKESQYGNAAHFNYKDKRHGLVGLEFKWFKNLFNNETELKKEEISKNVKWLNQIYDNYIDTNLENDSIVKNLEKDFLKERIFVFTPKNDVVDLPTGASVIDFAYSIHSSIGSSVEGAHINGNFKSINTILKNGDIAEIKYNKNKKTVTHKWLKYAKTQQARAKIRSDTKHLI